MNDITHTSDMLRQLQSLSIERVAPGRAEDQKHRRRLWPLRSLALLVLLTGAGAAGFYATRGGESDPFWVQAQALKPDWLADAAPAPSDAQAAEPVQSAIAAPPAPVSSPAVVGSGYVLAEREMTLMPDLGGRLAEVLVQTGDTFTEGQVIATLDDGAARTDLKIAEATLTMARAALADADASLAEARAGFDRQKALEQRGSVARAQAESAEFILTRAERNHEMAAAEVEIARLGVEKQADFVARHRILAPFSGVVVQRYLNPGDIAVSAFDGGPDQAIATLIDPANLRIEVDVAESNLSRVAPGQGAEVLLDAWPSRPLRATVQNVAPKISIQRGTVLVRLTFDTPQVGVFANMAAKVTFDLNNDSAARSEQTADLLPMQKGN